MTLPQDRDGLMRLVIPETLQQDFLHHYHTSLEGGHQVSAEPIRRLDRDSIGEDCTGAFNDMWANVPTVKPEKEAQ